MDVHASPAEVPEPKDFLRPVQVHLRRAASQVSMAEEIRREYPRAVDGRKSHQRQARRPLPQVDQRLQALPRWRWRTMW